MSDWLRNHRFVLLAFLVWRASLFAVQVVGHSWWLPQANYLGELPWANFDGHQYVVIARQGYLGYQQAYFPLYPMMISFVHRLFPGFPPIFTALIISHVSFFFGLVFFYDLAKKFGKNTAKMSVLLLLTFPASFFFASAYTESLFFFFALLSFWMAENKRFFLSGIAGMLASATRLFGIFLLPYLLWKRARHFAFLVPLGLLSYMAYLQWKLGDPLAFIHVQPNFGANRTVDTFVLLPQVIWRYTKIFVTASPFTFTYAVSAFEFVSLLYALVLLGIAWRAKIPRPLVYYAAAVVLIPTCTGTLSSLPRYMLSAFPLFFAAGTVHNSRIQMVVLALGIVGSVVATSLFLGGIFVS